MGAEILLEAVADVLTPGCGRHRLDHRRFASRLPTRLGGVGDDGARISSNQSSIVAR